MQRDLVVILCGNIYNHYKIVKTSNCKYCKIISAGNNFVFIYILLSVGVWWRVCNDINEDKIVPSTDNFTIFAI
jgi:hypothetical protein